MIRLVLATIFIELRLIQLTVTRDRLDSGFGAGIDVELHMPSGDSESIGSHSTGVNKCLCTPRAEFD